jgi:hypothetical protein
MKERQLCRRGRDLRRTRKACDWVKIWPIPTAGGEGVDGGKKRREQDATTETTIWRDIGGVEKKSESLSISISDD